MKINVVICLLYEYPALKPLKIYFVFKMLLAATADSYCSCYFAGFYMNFIIMINSFILLATKKNKKIFLLHKYFCIIQFRVFFHKHFSNHKILTLHKILSPAAVAATNFFIFMYICIYIFFVTKF